MKTQINDKIMNTKKTETQPSPEANEVGCCDLLAALQAYSLEVYRDNDDDEQCHRCQSNTAVFAVQTAEDDYNAWCPLCVVAIHREDCEAEKQAWQQPAMADIY